VLDDRSLDGLRETNAAHFSDHFRLEGIAAGCGTWFDLDIIFLKPLPDDPYVLGWQSAGRVGNSIMRFPAGDACLRNYLDFCRQRPMPRYVMPWYSWTRKLTRSIKGAIAPLVGAPLPNPKFGPDALTYFVKKHGLVDVVARQAVYYPVPIDASIVRLMDQESIVEAFLRADTVCLHAWRTTYFKARGSSPPTSGWLAKQLMRHHMIANKAR
jgi:hypothetical protein